MSGKGSKNVDRREERGREEEGGGGRENENGNGTVDKPLMGKRSLSTWDSTQRLQGFISNINSDKSGIASPGSRYSELLMHLGSNRSSWRKELACAVLLIITTLRPAVLWCFLCPCHELLSVILQTCKASKMWPSACSYKQSFIGTCLAHLFSYRLWLLPCHNGRVVATGTGWPKKLKFFSLWSFAKDVCQPCSRGGRY